MKINNFIEKNIILINNDIKHFIEKNIILINNGIKKFCKSNSKFKEFEIKEYLKAKLVYDMEDKINKAKIMTSLEKCEYKKSEIINIANSNVYYKTDLENFFKSQFLNDINNLLNEDIIQLLSEDTLKNIEKLTNIENSKFNFIRTDLETLLKKTYFLVSQGGFLKNIININDGIMTANAGDSAQFLFISRAILAGFNCSNVDVRSSKYDAVIDYNNRVLRIQVKGVSSGNSISFIDRARGGQGIDYKHERNQGKRITSSNCDLYIAVDKQIGICYIIPMKYADSLTEKQAKRVTLKELEFYRENWEIIKECAEN